MEEGEKVDLKVTEEEDTLEPTEEVEKLRTLDRKETIGKGDESKSEETIVVQDKQGVEYEIE